MGVAGRASKIPLVSAIQPPPIPAHMVGKITPSNTRWYPTQKILWNIQQDIIRGTRMHESDAKATRAILAENSGLRPGESRDYAQAVLDKVSVLY